MQTTTKFGFPKGRVAQTLRRILYPDLTEHEVEAIVVCLMTHLLIEDRINGLIFRSHVQRDARPPEGEKAPKTSNALWEILVKMGFTKKYDLVEPFFAQLFPKEAEIVWKINDLRNTIFHGHAVKGAEFEGKRISDEETVENIFLSGQFAAMQLDKFEEMMSGRYQIAEDWAKKAKGWLANVVTAPHRRMPRKPLS